MKTPMDIGVYLSKNKGNRIDQLKYSWIIKNLIYIMNCTRPDIAYSVSKQSWFLSNLIMDH
jgi:hypothetical protein